MALTRDQIDDLAEEGVFLGSVYEIAQAIEAEVRKQDEALIRQMLEALEQSNATLWEEDDDPTRPAHEAITAARARLGEGNGL